jgi:tetratricopeptide (TPR) repeat protein
MDVSVSLTSHFRRRRIMTIESPETLFLEGMTLLADDRYADASLRFERALLRERERGGGRRPMRYLSFYGLSLALAHGVTPEAVRACETAARRDFFDPDLQLNLGRVYLLAGKTSPALQAFWRGLQLNPRHPALQIEFAKADRRSRPMLPFLRRDHALNRWLGRVRRAMASSGRRNAQPARSPLARQPRSSRVPT